MQMTQKLKRQKVIEREIKKIFLGIAHSPLFLALKYTIIHNLNTIIKLF